MKSLIIIISALFFPFYNVAAQVSMTKDDIMVTWTAKDTAPTMEEFTNVSFAEKSNSRINAFLDSLTHSHIDSFIIYTVSYPGYISSDTCFDYLYPIRCYVFWNSGQQLNIKLFKGKCEQTSKLMDSFGIFIFLHANQNVITKETVMPVILSGERLKGDTIRYSTSVIYHEPNYSIRIKNGASLKIFSFTQSDLQSSESLFHEHNSALKSIHLWQLIQQQVHNEFN